MMTWRRNEGAYSLPALSSKIQSSASLSKMHSESPTANSDGRKRTIPVGTKAYSSLSRVLIRTTARTIQSASRNHFTPEDPPHPHEKSSCYFKYQRLPARNSRFNIPAFQILRS